MRTSRLALVGVAISIATLAGACGASEDLAPTPSGPDSATTPLEPVPFTVPQKNIEAWVLPLDDALLSDSEPLLDTYASTLLAVDCMNDQGYSLPYPAIDTSAISDRLQGRRLTVDIAMVSGYLGASHDLSFLDPLNDYLSWIDSQDAQLVEDFRECFREGSTILAAAGSPYEAHNYTRSLALNVSLEAFHDPAVVSAIEEWRVCVAKAGIIGAAESPQDMPTDAMMQSLGIVLEDTSEYYVSEAERDVAVRDATCREESNYNVALYDALWARQIEIVENADTPLLRALATLQTWRLAVAEVLAAHPNVVE